MAKLDEDFLYNIYSIVEEIPEGKVSTYGQIARLAGYEKNSRMVGKAMSYAELYGDFPCFRVVHSDGTLVHGWQEQRQMLIDDGVIFKSNGKVDLKKSGWDYE